MSSVSSSSVTNKPGIAPKVDTQDQNPEIADANTLAIKKATSLPHFNQSAGALLSHVQDMEDQQRKEKKRVVDYETYNQSFQNMINSLVKSDQNKSDTVREALQNLRFDGHTLARMNFSDMTLKVSTLCLTVFANTADAKSRASQIMTDTQCTIRTEKVKQFQDQLAKQVAAAQKAKKLGIIGCLLDWIVSVAEAAYGIFKLIEGVGELIGSFGCDPNAYASLVAGVAYTGAGTAGMVKAAAETAKVLGADPKICDKVAEIAGYVQLGAEMIGLVTDIFGAGLAFKAASGAVKGAATAATKAAEVAGEQVTKAVAKGVSEAGTETAMELSEVGTQAATKTMSEVAEEVSEKVADEIGESIVNKIVSESVREVVEETGEATEKVGQKVAKKLGKLALKRLVKRVTEAFGKKAVKKMVKESLEEAMKDAAKQAEKGITRSTTRIISDMNTKILKQCMTAALKMTLKTAFFTAIYGVGAGMSLATKGENTKEQGKFTKEIQNIMLKSWVLTTLSDDFEKSGKEEEKQIKDVLSKSATVMQNTKDALEQFMQVSVKIAVNIGRA